jgi:hypothetical protein
MKTATPREEEGRRRVIHHLPQGGGKGRCIPNANPREEEGADARVSVLSQGGGEDRTEQVWARMRPNFGCGDPREEEGAAAIPTGLGRR